MSFNRSLFWKIISIIIKILIPASLAIGLTFSIINDQKQQKLDVKNYIDSHLKTNQSNNPFEKPNPSWSLDKLNFINKNINYKNQTTTADFSNLFRDKRVNKINKLVIASNVNFDNTHFNSNQEIEFNNLTLMIDNLLNNYHHRYLTSNTTAITKLNNVNITNPNYLNVISSKNDNYSSMNNAVFDFSLAPTTNPKYNLIPFRKVFIGEEDFTNETSKPDRNIIVNNYYKLECSKYWQYTNDNYSNFYSARQIVIDWNNPESKNKEYIDASTLNFWIDFFINNTPRNVKRLVVKPANIIIYRSNVESGSNNISLSAKSLKTLTNNKTSITIDNWMESCINYEPVKGFDVRNRLMSSVIKNIESLNIPRIVTVNDDQYLNNQSYYEAKSIVNNFLYTMNDRYKDRNWGKQFFEHLNELIISMNPDDGIFAINNANNILVAKSYTNASANTGFDNVAMPVIGKQFFTMPNLKTLSSNDINIFFRNFNIDTYLPLYKSYNENFSEASYLRYKDLNINFLCEQSGDFQFNLNDFLNRGASYYNNSIDGNNISKNLNNYLNYFNDNRNYQQQTYYYFEWNQNQWLANDIVLKSSKANETDTNEIISNIRYEFLYGFYDHLINIVFPFSLIKSISNEANPLFLNLNNKNNLIARLIDPLTNTIFYNSYLFADSREEIYPSYLLNNESFANLIDKKIVANNGNKENLNLTFDDWVNNAWTGIDPSLDIFKVIDNKKVSFNEFLIPNIVQMNVGGTLILNKEFRNQNSIISLVLIVVIVTVVIIEILITIIVVKLRDRDKWIRKTISIDYIG